MLRGSWGRREITRESDDDFIVLFEGEPADSARPSIEDVAGALGGRPPGPEEIFGSHVLLDDLRAKIGRDEDTKLRLSRKALFAGGLLPVLDCYGHPVSDMLGYLDERMSVPPLDRLADAFVDRGALDPGVRVLTAYDEFLAILDDGEKRRKLSELGIEDAAESSLFTRIAELGKELEAGLLALLFDDPGLHRWVREYLVF
ncbi:MAG: hypothetical protein ABI323_09470 [Solirubrobacteraceae bacterium]